MGNDSNLYSARTHCVVPVILFAYARPDHLTRTLACLRENAVPLIYAFSDGPQTADKEPLVRQVREILRKIDWCEVVLCERKENLGLGKSVLTGVTEVLVKHEMCIVFEDDLICASGTYRYLCEALLHYKNDIRVMSVTGWNHKLVTPPGITDQPYFDGRAECWCWGTWRRAWQGMCESALTLIQSCRENGIDPYIYGADLVAMANKERARNIWAVRFVYWHILNNGLCLRTPWSMVQHIGAGISAENVATASWCDESTITTNPAIPQQWPEPVLRQECKLLWQKVCGNPSTNKAGLLRRIYVKIKKVLSRFRFFTIV